MRIHSYSGLFSQKFRGLASGQFGLIVRVVRTLLIILVFAQAARAQSTLNFVHGFEDKSPIAIVNTTSNFADVQFTFYQPDGSMPGTTALLNPVSYRISPKGRLSMPAAEIFGGKLQTGWIQATSFVSGLAGQAADTFSEQVIPLLIQGTKIQITNPGEIPSDGFLTFYDIAGREIRVLSGNRFVMNAHEQIEMLSPLQATSVRVSSEFPVSAGSFLSIDGKPWYVQGQSTNNLSITRTVAISQSKGSRTLFLSNPATNPVTILVSLVGNSSALVAPKTFEIPGNGSIRIWLAPNTTGFIRVDSTVPVALSGVLELNTGSSISAVPLQAASMDQMVFSQTSTSARLSLLNPVAQVAKAEITLSNANGQTIRQKVQDVTGSQTISLRDLLASGENAEGNFITVRVDGGRLYASEALDNSGLSYRTPQSIPNAFVPNSAVNIPTWLEALRRSTPGDIHAGDQVEARVRNVGEDVAVFCLGRQIDTLEIRSDAPGTAVLRFVMPQIEPGFVNCRIRSGGVESQSARVRVMDAAGTLTATLPGEAFYQKPEVTDAGLELDRTTLRPIRNVRIEVLDTVSGKLLSVSESDDNGRFLVAVPPDATNLSIQAVSRLRSLDLKVEDNTNANQLYVISLAHVDMREATEPVSIVDRTRTSGAFNILEQIQRANEFVHQAVPQFAAFPFTIFWSEKNQKIAGNVKDGFVGTTAFSLASGTAYVLGDRNTDSDEFDDSVLLHEYGHMLAAKFSRDDSPGGIHHLGDKLDPRVAWSEGWANFFSGAVRNDSIYRDSQGPGGSTVLRFDLEENYPAGSSIGSGSETSVQALLWDFLDEKNEPGDYTQFDFSAIWRAFSELSVNRWVYLPYFLDHLEEDNPMAGDPIQRMAQAQGIEYQPDAIPSDANPFPSYIAIGSSQIGESEVDSLTTKRTNLARSSHFYAFTTSGGPVSIQLNVSPGSGNPNANDLDLYLFDSNGKLISKSYSGNSGQSESISGLQLPAGAYVIEVRSYFTNRGGVTVYNSGKYTLSLNRQ